MVVKMLFTHANWKTRKTRKKTGEKMRIIDRRTAMAHSHT